MDEVRNVLGSWTDLEAEQAASLMLRLDEAIAQTYTDDAQRRLLATALIAMNPIDDPTDHLDHDQGTSSKEPAPPVLASA